MDQIPYHEISFHPHSYGDPDGRLFWWNGHLYRGISHEKTPFFKQLFEDDILQKVIDRGVLIDSEPVELILEGYGMILRHYRVPFVSYPHEWCAPMFKDAALAYLNLVSELIPRGLTLKDTHPWNLLFDGCKPIYVDLTSIKPITDHSNYLAYDKFRRYYLYPLILMSQGQERIARHLLPDYEGISYSDFSLLTQKRIPPRRLSSIKNRLSTALEQRMPEACRERVGDALRLVRSVFCKEPRGQNSQLDDLKNIKREIESVPLPAPGAGRSKYDANSIPLHQDTQQSLDKVIAELRPASILAIGAKLGTYAMSRALAGNRVLSFDKDATYVIQLYYNARDKNLPLLPLVIDFNDPTPSRGLASHLSLAATERLQCDMVVTLGLVDQLVLQRYLRFDQIVDGLAQFSKRWLLIDFIPRNGCQPKADRYPWYTCDNFMNALGKKFCNISVLSCHPESHRLLFCEK